MPTKIKSLNELMKRLAAANAEFVPVASAAMATCTVKVQADAKSKFGHYQPEIGPYNEWAELAPATIRAKELAGAEGDDPLIGHYQLNDKNGNPRHDARPGGQLRASILAEVRGLSGEVGTNDKLGPYHEFGTSRGIPPRPFLRPALFQNEDFIREAMKGAIATVMQRV